jgi:hypothetical protein
MQYLMMLWLEEDGWLRLTKDEQQKQMGAYTAFREAIGKAGVFKGSNRLQNSSISTTVRVTDGKTKVLDGPYADSKEQIAGYFLIDAPDLDAAISWAARCPGAHHGVVELRPVWTMEGSSAHECEKH